MFLSQNTRVYTLKTDFSTRHWKQHTWKTGLDVKYNRVQNLTLTSPNGESNGLPGGTRSDYVNFNRGLGVKEAHTVRYIFRNAMLPQFTGLALSIAAIITGGLITELVFSYPGLGTLLFSAIGQNDYPVISAITLLITIAVLIANLAADILTGFIDPRIRAVQSGER